MTMTDEEVEKAITWIDPSEDRRTEKQRADDSASAAVEILAHGILQAAYRLVYVPEDALSYLLLIEEIQVDIEQYCLSIRGQHVRTIEFLTKACVELADYLHTIRVGGARCRHLRPVPSAEAIDWLHEEGLYPMMSRSFDEHADGDEEDTSEQ